MKITISFRPGFDVQGVVLSVTETRLRVAVKDWDDAAEFQQCDGQWFSENLEPVHIAWPEPLCGATTEGVQMHRWCGRASQQPALDWVN